MNKLFATIALAALAFTSCIKEDDSWKDLLPVQPGMTIYQSTMAQNTLAMQPANAAMRLAILLAEADKQGLDLAEADLKNVKVENSQVQVALFGSLTKIERQADGNYLITYNEDSVLPGGHYMSGSMLVKTNGAPLLSEASSNAWKVEMQNLKLYGSDQNGYRVTYLLLNGETSLYANGDGSYSIEVMGFRAQMQLSNSQETPPYSNWSGNFNLTAEDSSLAYSLCAGKNFKVYGNASGPTFYASVHSGGDGVGMGYELENGIFRGLTIVSGTQECRFTSYFDYDTSQFPASSVRFVWTFNEAANTYSYKIYYNNYVYPKD